MQPSSSPRSPPKAKLKIRIPRSANLPCSADARRDGLRSSAVMAIGENQPNTQWVWCGCSWFSPPVLIGFPDAATGESKISIWINNLRRQRIVNFIFARLTAGRSAQRETEALSPAELEFRNPVPSSGKSCRLSVPRSQPGSVVAWLPPPCSGRIGFVDSPLGYSAAAWLAVLANRGSTVWRIGQLSARAPQLLTTAFRNALAVDGAALVDLG
jgi:hypothetical protein